MYEGQSEIYFVLFLFVLSESTTFEWIKATAASAFATGSAQAVLSLFVALYITQK